LHQRVVLLLRHCGQVEENAYWPAVRHQANLRGPAVARNLVDLLARALARHNGQACRSTIVPTPSAVDR
jgi:hypothetical protein